MATCDTLAHSRQVGNEKRDLNPALKASESCQVISVLTTTHIQKVMIHPSKISAEIYNMNTPPFSELTKDEKYLFFYRYLHVIQVVGWSTPIIEGSYLWGSLWSTRGWIWVSLYQPDNSVGSSCYPAVLQPWECGKGHSSPQSFSTFFVSSVLPAPYPGSSCFLSRFSFIPLLLQVSAPLLAAVRGKSLWWHSQRDLTLYNIKGSAWEGQSGAAQILDAR